MTEEIQMLSEEILPAWSATQTRVLLRHQRYQLLLQDFGHIKCKHLCHCAALMLFSCLPTSTSSRLAVSIFSYAARDGWLRYFLKWLLGGPRASRCPCVQGKDSQPPAQAGKSRAGGFTSRNKAICTVPSSDVLLCMHSSASRDHSPSLYPEKET